MYFPHHWYAPDPATFGPRAETGFEAARSQLAEYFAGDRRRFRPAAQRPRRRVPAPCLAPDRAIPYGETVTYGELAAELGSQVAARDVGAAVGRNPLSVVVPCHRVVGKDGRLTGYAGGLARKRFLLDLEEAAARKSARMFWKLNLTLADPGRLQHVTSKQPFEKVVEEHGARCCASAGRCWPSRRR